MRSEMTFRKIHRVRSYQAGFATKKPPDNSVGCLITPQGVGGMGGKGAKKKLPDNTTSGELRNTVLPIPVTNSSQGILTAK